MRPELGIMHKAHPAFEQHGITTPWKPLPDEVKRGLQLAAYICRMYGAGETWAEVILDEGEQIRGLWWMEYEKLVAEEEHRQKEKQ